MPFIHFSNDVIIFRIKTVNIYIRSKMRYKYEETAYYIYNNDNKTR